jgi:FKBP-type peptidyl-prolyl cis-trans isomerase SlpA
MRYGGDFVRALTCILSVAFLCHFPFARAAADEGASGGDGAAEAVSEEAAVPDPPEVIGPGARIWVEYELSMEDGTVMDDNNGDLLRYDYEKSPMFPKINEAILGLSRGDTKHIMLEPEDGYGVSDPTKVATIDAASVHPEARSVGTFVPWRLPNGSRVTAKVIEVNGDEVVIDYNHPLAGKRLLFDVKVIRVQAGRN